MLMTFAVGGEPLVGGFPGHEESDAQKDLTAIQEASEREHQREASPERRVQATAGSGQYGASGAQSM